MKLIRISTENDNGIFETQFNQSIDVEPFSKIALSSISANLKPLFITLTNTTIKFTFLIDGYINYKFSILLKDGTYDRNNIGVLLTEITDKMNAKMAYVEDIDPSHMDNTTLYGVEFRAYIDDKKINFEVGKGWTQTTINKLNRWNADDVSKIGNDVAGSSHQLCGLKGTVINTSYPGYTNCFTSMYPLSKGMGYVSVQYRKFNIDTTHNSTFNEQGWLLALTEEETSPSSMTVDKIVFGVGLSSKTGLGANEVVVYRQEKGVMTDTTERIVGNLPERDGETLFLLKSGNSVVIMIERADGTRYELHTYAHTSSKPLYPVMIYHGNNYNTLTYIPRASFSPYELVSQPSIPLTPFMTQSYEFETELPTELADFFNYDTPNLSSPERIYNANLIAPEMFIPALLERNFLLELITFNVESYDSTQKQRRNIISNIISANENDVVSNETNIIFIDLNNKDKLDMRNLTMRLVDEYYNPVNITGTATAVLLIANKDEKI